MCDFAPFGADASNLAGELDDLGLVVEEVQHVGRGLEDVVVAAVLEIASIPGADRIRRVVVDRGAGQQVEVVCGAWNFSEGDLVALAPVGAVLPGGFEIARRKMKGVVSNGMLCSGSELELSDDHSGIMVLGKVGGGDVCVEAPEPGMGTPEPGMALTEALGIESDVVFDIAVDANRPDAASVAGVARDLAARLHLPFTLSEPVVSSDRDESPPVGRLLSLEVVDRDLCPRFTARVLTDVRVGPSPRWVERRLTLAGMLPINNVVDASNYVMLELGQPTHPYDLDRVGGGGLRVRAARPLEVVETLDGTQRTMAERPIGRDDDLRDCVICDAEDTAIGIAGVMGGATSEIGESTTRVLLEAAYFSPMAIARTSKRLGLRTEASTRFERGVDPEGIDRAALRLCELLAMTAGDAMTLAPGSLDERGEVPEPRPVRVRSARVNALLGSDMSDLEIARHLEPIGFGTKVESPGLLTVTVPMSRPDAEREVDVIEEVGRHYGYARLPRRRPFPPQVGRLTRYQRERRLLREVLAGTGADEAWTAPMLAEGDHERAGIGGAGWSAVRLSNPLTPEESVLRQSLLPGMLKALEFNVARRQGSIRIFEIGKVFPVPGTDRVNRAMAHQDPVVSVVDEREMVGVLLADEGDDARRAVGVWHTLASALDLKGVELRSVDLRARDSGGSLPLDGLHPTRTAELVAETKIVGAKSAGSDEDEGGGTRALTIGKVGEVDPSVLERFGIDTASQRVGWIEVDLGLVLEQVPRKAELAAPVSRFPSSDVDLAFLLEESIPAAAVSATIEGAAGDLLESLSLFDVYRGRGVPEGFRSLAWRLRFCALDRTLSDAEIGQLRTACIRAVERSHGAQLRT
jgi:phenylalanyl-tRNA synthetase beta chain